MYILILKTDGGIGDHIHKYMYLQPFATISPLSLSILIFDLNHFDYWSLRVIVDAPLKRCIPQIKTSTNTLPTWTIFLNQELSICQLLDLGLFAKSVFSPYKISSPKRQK